VGFLRAASGMARIWPDTSLITFQLRVGGAEFGFFELCGSFFSTCFESD
jgi:hypothetical protein